MTLSPSPRHLSGVHVQRHGWRYVALPNTMRVWQDSTAADGRRFGINLPRRRCSRSWYRSDLATLRDVPPSHGTHHLWPSFAQAGEDRRRHWHRYRRTAYLLLARLAPLPRSCSVQTVVELDFARLAFLRDRIRQFFPPYLLPRSLQLRDGLDAGHPNFEVMASRISSRKPSAELTKVHIDRIWLRLHRRRSSAQYSGIADTFTL